MVEFATIHMEAIFVNVHPAIWDSIVSSLLTHVLHILAVMVVLVLAEQTHFSVSAQLDILGSFVKMALSVRLIALETPFVLLGSVVNLTQVESNAYLHTMMIVIV